MAFVSAVRLLSCYLAALERCLLPEPRVIRANDEYLQSVSVRRWPCVHLSIIPNAVKTTAALLFMASIS